MPPRRRGTRETRPPCKSLEGGSFGKISICQEDIFAPLILPIPISNISVIAQVTNRFQRPPLEGEKKIHKTPTLEEAF